MNPLITSQYPATPKLGEGGSLITTIRLRSALSLIALVFGSFALAQGGYAVSPAPDGGYANGTTAEGTNALFGLTTGVWNTALGFEALNHDTAGKDNTATGLRSLFSNNSGNYNTANGVYALYANINGWYNSAVGAFALANNISGNHNTANGYGALYNNTTINGDSGSGNTATGFGALYKNAIGSSNTATGNQALNRNTTGHDNTATGADALFHNTEGYSNSAFGSGALYLNTTGVNNTATGAWALLNNTGSDNTANGYAALNINGDGIQNTATGAQALLNNSSGIFNTAVGYQALGDNATGGTNTAVGVDALIDNISGGANTALGYGAGANVTTGSFNVYIGTNVAGVADEVGHTYISNINSTIQPPVNGSEYVTVRLSDGLLGHTSSSLRYKEDIKPMDSASEVLYRLKPVTYRYKKNIDPSQNLDYGLVAEDVAKVDPKLTIRDGNGQIESVRYTAIYNMLLNEFLKEHKKVAEQQTSITRLKSAVAKQEALIVEQQKNFQSKLAEEEKQIEALASGLQKVSARIEVSKPAGRVVLNNHNGENPKAETESQK